MWERSEMEVAGPDRLELVSRLLILRDGSVAVIRDKETGTEYLVGGSATEGVSTLVQIIRSHGWKKE